MKTTRQTVIISDFKIKRTRYRVVVDGYQYTLERLSQSAKDWAVVGHYIDLFYVLKKLVMLGAIELKTRDTLEKSIYDTLELLKKSILSQDSPQMPRDRQKVVGQ